MTPDETAIFISGGGFILSILGSIFSVGVFKGRTDARIAILEANQDKLATKEQLAGVKEDLAEIKGMFRMTLKEPL
jgi:hypothetical protein